MLGQKTGVPPLVDRWLECLTWLAGRAPYGTVDAALRARARKGAQRWVNPSRDAEHFIFAGIGSHFSVRDLRAAALALARQAHPGFAASCTRRRPAHPDIMAAIEGT